MVPHLDSSMPQRRVDRAGQDLARLLLIVLFWPVDLAFSMVGNRSRNFRLATGADAAVNRPARTAGAGDEPGELTHDQ